MDNLLMITVLSMAISMISTPFVKKIAIRVKAIDIPKDYRRVHKKPIPLMGGVAIYLSFLIMMLLKKGSLSIEELGILFGSTIIIIGGILDDIYEIKPWQKLMFQLFASISLIISGVRIELITNPFGATIPYFNIGLLYIPITILWVIGITNAINLIDGLDGLAAGVALISALAMLIVAIIKDRVMAATLISILSGAILGFLPYNFNPASIFMGDTGSQLLGFILAAISIEGAIKSATAFAIAPPILALGLPIFDTVFAMVRRKVNGKPMMQGDRGHLHHRLLDRGFSQRQVVVIMYLISAVLGLISVIAMKVSSANSYFLLTIVVLIIVFICWRIGLFEHKE